MKGADSKNYVLQGELPEGSWDITEVYQNSRLKPYVIREASENCIFPAVMVMTYGESFQDARMLAGSGTGTFLIVDENNQSLADQKLNAGTYSNTYRIKFTPSDGTAASYGSSTLIMQKAPLTVTVENASKIYGEGRPDYTWTVTEGTLVEGDDLKELLTVRSVLSGQEEEGNGNSTGSGTVSGDERTSPVNVYDIVLDQQLNNNYDLTFIGAKLTIYKADPKAVFPKELNAYKGTLLGDLSFEAGADVPGAFTFEAADTVLGSSGTYKMIFTPKDSQNYHAAEAMITIHVSERPKDGNGGSGGSGSGSSGGSGSGDSGTSGSGWPESSAARKADSANTADNSPILLYSVLALLSFAFAAAMAAKKKKQ